MKPELADTKNVRRFMGALSDLENRPMGVEGMGLLYGQPGEGKTTVVAYATNVMNGIFLRANACWTVTAMLSDLTIEVGGEVKGRKAPMIRDITKKLLEDPRPIFIDEADYLLRKSDMLDTLRDIYDLTGVLVVFIGMEELGRRLTNSNRFSRFARRITQWIDFKGIDVEDSRLVADTICEIFVADDLLESLHKAAMANIGRMVTGLSMIERLGKTNNLDEVTLKDWGNRPFYYGQPYFGRQL